MEVTPFELERLLEKRMAERAVQNLIGRFCHLNTARRDQDILDIWSKAPDARIEQPWGVYDGPEGVRRFFTEEMPAHDDLEARRGDLSVDCLSTAVIEVATDVKTAVSKLRIRYFPILDNDDKYVGMISQRNLLDIDRQKVILVDHNEKGQAVDGIRSAEVIEVIDHHRIDSVETMNPIYFRNQPLGCTATIITMMYRENGVEIEPKIAALLCSAILSDTLMFRSPTCTPFDEAAARDLARIADIDVEEHAMAMFNAGSKLSKKSPDEIFHLDCKSFRAEPYAITVSQVTSVSRKELSKVKEKLLPYMESLLPNSGADMLFLMLTNIIDESTELLFVGQGAKGYVEAAFEQETADSCVKLPGVVSRKKQVLAPLITAIETA